MSPKVNSNLLSFSLALLVLYLVTDRQAGANHGVYHSDLYSNAPADYYNEPAHGHDQYSTHRKQVPGFFHEEVALQEPAHSPAAAAAASSESAAAAVASSESSHQHQTLPEVSGDSLDLQYLDHSNMDESIEPMYEYSPEFINNRIGIPAETIRSMAPGKASRRSKIFGRRYYNDYQRWLDDQRRVEKMKARDTKDEIKQAVKEAPRIRLNLKKIPVLPSNINDKVKLVHDAENNARIYKRLIKDKLM